MRVAFLHYTPKGHNPANFYYYGWGAALKNHKAVHEIVEKNCDYNSLKESDGEFDLCFVTPGFVDYKKHLYKKRSKRTKYILVADEDMHQSIEGLECIAKYYDYMFIHSEKNYTALQLLGSLNVRCILPCYNPEIFYPIELDKKYDISFLGQSGAKFDIVGSTRIEYCKKVEADPDISEFLGRGFYAQRANAIYNNSKIALDLPIMSVVGGRSFCVGATSATLMLPSSRMTLLWRDSFVPNEDFIEFSSACTFKDTVKKWIYRPEDRLRLRNNMNTKVKKHTYTERFKMIMNVIMGAV